ncbi:von Willebrand factor A domain-containing protein 1-like [Ambystoma mexicanum]|uniref:von Willebrand factor A domain-containing protein 1-like n=1 Tax=Ambystoma mexicanum TaxID=8296 RepID=UPI0037E99C2B
MGALAELLLCLLLSATLCPADVRRGATGQAGADLSVCRASHHIIDLLLLVDISGSITTLELNQTRDLVQRLTGGFDVGPSRVQVSLLLVSDQPSLVVNFLEPHFMMRHALDGLEYGWGDTNSGRALDYAREHVFTSEAGGRDNASRVILWITDGLSTDDVTAPARRLKETGVKILVVSTGRRSAGLHFVASEPSEDTLFFVAVESLSSMAGVLCRAVIDSVAPRALQVSEVTPHSFRVSWPRNFGRRDDHLILDYSQNGGAQGEEPKRFLRRVRGDMDSALLSGLSPNTTYEMTLLSPQHHDALWARARTEEEEQTPEKILIRNRGVHSLSLAWPGTLKHVLRFQVLYGPMLGSPVRSLTLNGSVDGVTLSPLRPNTIYLVTVRLELRSGRHRTLSVSGRTLQGMPRRPPPHSLMLTDVTSASLVASWARSGRPALKYEVHLGAPGGVSRSVTVPGHVQMVVLQGLKPDILHSVCIRAVYKRGSSGGLCAKEKTKSAPMPRRQAKCPPHAKTDRQRSPPGRRWFGPIQEGRRRHAMGIVH